MRNRERSCWRIISMVVTRMREADEARRIAGYLARLNISRPAQMYILHMAEDMVREHERARQKKTASAATDAV